MTLLLERGRRGADDGTQDYIYALITGYVDPPAGVEIREGLNYSAFLLFPPLLPPTTANHKSSQTPTSPEEPSEWPESSTTVSSSTPTCVPLLLLRSWTELTL